MRLLPALLGLLVAAPAFAQVDDDSLSLLIRVERAAWAAADEALEDADHLFRLDAGEDLAEQLRDARQRAYEMGVEAARSDLLFEFVAALRQERGDAIPRCEDEEAVVAYLDQLLSAGDDLIEMDATRFSSEEPFDPADLASRLEAMTAPMRAVVARHLDEPEDRCAAAPEPHHPPGHTP